MTVTKVYQAIAAVQGALAQTGIAKDRQGAGIKYKFRGIDDVYNALAPLLAEHKLCIIPRVLSRECAERKASSGGNLFYTTVHAEFDFVSAEDGSKHTASTFGEAMDSSDKSTNKAMSAAYKYAAFMTFCIPVEGDNDTENSNHVPQPQKSPDELRQDQDAALAKIETLIVAINAAGNKMTQMPILKQYSVANLRELTPNDAADVIRRLGITLDEQNAKNAEKETK